MLLGGQKSTIVQHMRGILKFEEQLARVKWLFFVTWSDAWLRFTLILVLAFNRTYLLSISFFVEYAFSGVPLREYTQQSHNRRTPKTRSWGKRNILWLISNTQSTFQLLLEDKLQLRFLVFRDAGNNVSECSFLNISWGACLQTPLGALRFKHSKGALRRQKNVTSSAFTNMSATLQNCRNPWCLWFRSPVSGLFTLALLF